MIKSIILIKINHSWIDHNECDVVIDILVVLPHPDVITKGIVSIHIWKGVILNTTITADYCLVVIKKRAGDIDKAWLSIHARGICDLWLEGKVVGHVIKDGFIDRIDLHICERCESDILRGGYTLISDRCLYRDRN